MRKSEVSIFVLSVVLVTDGRNRNEYFFIALFSACLYLLYALLSYRKKVDDLADRIDKFFSYGTTMNFSLKDDHFSKLYNIVCDLENPLMKEKENRIKEKKWQISWPIFLIS